jgi:hypothetical protein
LRSGLVERCDLSLRDRPGSPLQRVHLRLQIIVAFRSELDNNMSMGALEPAGCRRFSPHPVRRCFEPLKSPTGYVLKFCRIGARRCTLKLPAFCYKTGWEESRNKLEFFLG